MAKLESYDVTGKYLALINAFLDGRKQRVIINREETSWEDVTIPKVTLKVINQDRMFFVDFSVNCQPILMKFCNNPISAESLYP